MGQHARAARTLLLGGPAHYAGAGPARDRALPRLCPRQRAPATPASHARAAQGPAVLLRVRHGHSAHGLLPTRELESVRARPRPGPHLLRVGLELGVYAVRIRDRSVREYRGPRLTVDF